LVNATASSGVLNIFQFAAMSVLRAVIDMATVFHPDRLLER
jgi:hypothetical protein